MGENFLQKVFPHTPFQKPLNRYKMGWMKRTGGASPSPTVVFAVLLEHYSAERHRGISLLLSFRNADTCPPGLPNRCSIIQLPKRAVWNRHCRHAPSWVSSPTKLQKCRYMPVGLPNRCRIVQLPKRASSRAIVGYLPY